MCRLRLGQPTTVEYRNEHPGPVARVARITTARQHRIGLRIERNFFGLGRRAGAVIADIQDVIRRSDAFAQRLVDDSARLLGAPVPRVLEHRQAADDIVRAPPLAAADDGDHPLDVLVADKDHPLSIQIVDLCRFVVAVRRVDRRLGEFVENDPELRVEAIPRLLPPIRRSTVIAFATGHSRSLGGGFRFPSNV
jgi:hypothetical protein